MKEQVKYIKKFLENKTSILVFYIDSYLNAKKKGDSFYYLEMLINLLNETEVVIDSLKLEKIPDNTFFNYLYYYNKQLDFSDYIDKYRYKNIFKEKYQESINIIKNNSLFEDYSFISFLIKKDMIEEKDKKKVYEYFLNQIFIRNVNIDKETFEFLIINWTKKLLNFNKNIVVQIKNSTRVVNNKVILNGEEISDLYENGCYKLIISIYKCVNKMRIYNTSSLDINNVSKIPNELKDELMANYMPSYYDDNKEILSYVLDDEVYAYTELKNLFKHLGIDFIEKDNKSVIKKPGNKRIYKGKEVDINDIFSVFILKNKDILERIKQND